MITTCIEPVVEPEQLKKLKDWNTQNRKQLENHLPVDRKLLGNVTDELGKIIQQTPHWMDVLQKIHNSGDHHMVQLVHEDNDFLNLPWGLAQDPISKQALGTIRTLYRPADQNRRREMLVSSADLRGTERSMQIHLLDTYDCLGG